jgi:inner membrane protein
MDNITHTLVGVMLSRAGLNRVSPHATLLLVLAANAPDVDLAARFAGPEAYLRYHHVATHSLIAIPVLALLVVALVRLLRRKNFSWGRAYLVALVGVATNPLLDCANSYGVRLLWPFSGQWINADFLPALDIWILVLLAAGLAGPWLSRMVSSEMGVKSKPSRGAAIAVLSLLGAYGFGRFLLHQRAIAVLDSRMYQGEVPRRVAAMPTAANPFQWVGLVEGQAFLELLPDMNLLGEFNPAGGSVYYKPDAGPVIDRARQIPGFQAFLGFAQWPVWTVTPAPKPEGGVMVEVSDLRFGPPGDSVPAAEVLLDVGGQVLKSSLRF